MTLYPEITPYETGMLDVGDGHRIYWECSGNAEGIPIIFLHGGPGSGTSPWQRQLFDPDKFRIILFDQRGAGKSTPHAELTHNTTAHLTDDIEKLRRHLNVERWHVAGGSWGSTLALAYADNNAIRIKSLTLYGIYLCRPQELAELYHDGGIVSRVFPDIFEPYLALLPEEDRSNPIKGYHKLFHSKDNRVRETAIDVWTRLENRVAALVVSPERLEAAMADKEYVRAHSLIENHYFLENGFIDGDRLLIELPEKLAGIPVTIIQGRYDMPCPMATAWALHKAIPHSRLHIVENAGHTAKEPDTLKKLVEIFDSL